MKAIVAVDKNWGIGKDGDLLFHLAGDMKYFRKTTKGKAIIIGRKTLESFPGSKPLPGRMNIVITRNENYAPAGIDICRSIDEYIEKTICGFVKRGGSDAHGSGSQKSYIVLCSSPDEAGGVIDEYTVAAKRSEDIGLQISKDNCYVCGGGEIYRQMLPACDEVLVTRIDADMDADAYFPNLDEDPGFVCTWTGKEMEDDGIRYRFTKYNRV